MRNPVPINGHVTRTPVRATLVDLTLGESLDEEDAEDIDETPDDEQNGDSLDYEDVQDDEDDEEPEEQKDAREAGASDEAPWAPVPLRPARDFVERNEDATIDVVFPTVYEEDRSAKLKDLATAQAVGAITHQRMSEQMAKELGFEQYNYDDELENIEIEMKKLPPGIISSTDQIGGAGKGGAGGGITIGAPSAGLASEDELEPRRADLSGKTTHEFRKQQHSTVSSTESDRIHAQMLNLRRDFVAALKELHDFRETTLREVLALAHREPSRVEPPVINVHPPNITVHPPDIKIEAPTITVQPPQVNVSVEPPKPRNVVVKRDERGLMTEMREESTE